MTPEGITFGRWVIPESEVEERFDTSGGPGGQHANKNETSVTLRFEPEISSLPEEIREKLSARLGRVVEVTASDTRSQWRNRALARERLAAKLETALIDPKPRKRTKPSRASRERRLESKKARSDTKQKRRPPDLD